MTAGLRLDPTVNLQLDAAAALIALVALFLAYRASRSSGHLQAALLQIEKDRRDEERESRHRGELTGRFIRVSEIVPGSQGFSDRLNRHDYLIIANRGLAPARNVHLELTRHDGTALDRRPLVLTAGELPIELIDADGEYAIPVVFTVGSVPRYRLHLTWTDATGQREKILPLRPVGL